MAMKVCSLLWHLEEQMLEINGKYKIPQSFYSQQTARLRLRSFPSDQAKKNLFSVEFVVG